MTRENLSTGKDKDQGDPAEGRTGKRHTRKGQDRFSLTDSHVD